MRFQCSFNYYPHPQEPNDFLRSGTVDVYCWPENGDEQIVARLAFDHLDIVRAEYAGENIYEVCDADSAGWEATYHALFESVDGNTQLRRDFEFDDAVGHVLFIHKVMFHPCLHEWRSYILDHVCHLIDTDSVTVMWKSTTDLSEKKLSDLGFRRIAGEELLFRPNMYRHSYEAANEARDPLSITIDEAAEDFIIRVWGDD
jgi:hypothetical protein